MSASKLGLQATVVDNREAPTYPHNDHRADPETEFASWFLAGLPREEVRRVAAELLAEGLPGEFFVR